jgi:hypothetical protein
LAGTALFGCAASAQQGVDFSKVEIKTTESASSPVWPRPSLLLCA